jgi:hypothetical protein
MEVGTQLSACVINVSTGNMLYAYAQVDDWIGSQNDKFGLGARL